MKIDITGQRFGRLIALSPAGKDERRRSLWLCRCDCGVEKVLALTNLRTGQVKSCGCLNAYPDITGWRFGKLTAIEKVGVVNQKSIWKCLCDCGKEILVPRRHLTSKATISCGCARVKRREGQRMGRLTVIEDAGRDKDGNVLWKCLCDCGNTIIVESKSFPQQTTKSCGCLIKDSAKTNINKYHQENLFEGTKLDALDNKPRSNNKSGVKGVFFATDRQKWIAYITFKKKRINLGTYKTFAEAVRARREAEIALYDPILEKYGKEKTSEEYFEKALEKANQRYGKSV